MGKCLVTKLNADINNTNILHLGEARIKIAVDKTPDRQYLRISVLDDTDLEIIGDSYFTDSGFNANLGKTMKVKKTDGIVTLYFKNADAEIGIRNKYKILDLSFSGASKSVDLASFAYTSSLNTINCEYTNVYGDISAFKNLSIRQIYLSGAKIYGDIASLKKITSLTNLGMNDCPDVYGDLSNLSGLTNLTYLYFNLSGLTGSIDNLKELTELTSVNLENRNAKFTGSIESLSKMSALKSFTCNNAELTGDLAKIPVSCTFVNFSKSSSTFTWSARPAGANILSILGDSAISNVDEMLIDQSSREASKQSQKIISVKGSRTSASDSAIQTLQQKGYTVSIIY